ncbi:MAG: hypothetical protein M1827_005128 [Pycnora praestabilis]|nr:MAG: hypothetical protein M1827_005128 [Pycnora praestabilis]
MYTSKFLNVDSPDQDLEKHEARLALALDFDQANRVLGFNNDSDEEDRSSLQCNRLLRRASTSIKPNRSYVDSRTIWKDNEWMIQGSHSLLDAPRLRDDFYCSLLAYSYTAHCLAVGLSNSVYLWSEKRGVQHFTPFATSFAYVTSLGFSSTGGRQSILAIGRADGQLSLWGLDSREAQFEALQPTSIACVAFQPNTTQRPSKDPACTTVIPTEGLLVGDEVGEVYYYSVEWPKDWSSGGWAGSLTVLARISVHTQQICGLSWSLDGEYFATGGNDNACCLFEVANTLGQGASIDDHTSQPMVEEYTDAAGETRNRQRVVLGQGQTIAINSGHEKHRWMHNAAVKAIAFCPWQRGLVATGGGSNDRCIHFYHTFSGACLATISVAAQVTSLIWSNTRREIAATFGYAQPEHPYRIAVFSWPDCQQVVAIPWSGEMRALYAIPYPGGPNERNPDGNGSEGGVWASRTSEEGCIVIASSDESVKFHEVWSEARRTTGGNKGLLGGSDILEELAGIDKEGSEVIR